MMRIALMATFTAAAVLPAVAWGQDVAASVDGGDRMALVDPSSASLPPDVARRVAELRRYGDRFTKAIRLIEAEAAKPSWAWEDECGHGDFAQMGRAPES